MPRDPRRALLVLSCLGVSACGEDDVSCPALVVTSATACDTTQQCVDDGFSTLRCVNGTCALPCNSDADCILTTSPECQQELGGAPPAVCADKLCRPACPDTPCAAGLQCHRGQCWLDFEDFELREGETFGSLDRYGWNGLPTELDNPSVQLAAQGRPNCAGGASCGVSVLPHRD